MTGVQTCALPISLKYEVRKIDELIEKIIPHFEKYPLHSAKHMDFLLFAKVCRMIKVKKHLDPYGMREIIKLSYQMNGSGRRKYSLQDMIAKIHSGEDIVSAFMKIRDEHEVPTR